MFWNSDVPVFKTDDDKASVTVWAGDYFLGEDVKQNSPPPDSWAADPSNDVAVLHITVQPGVAIVIPKANKSGDGNSINRNMYLIEGHESNVKVDGKVISEDELGFHWEESYDFDHSH